MRAQEAEKLLRQAEKEKLDEEIARQNAIKYKLTGGIELEYDLSPVDIEGEDDKIIVCSCFVV